VTAGTKATIPDERPAEKAIRSTPGGESEAGRPRGMPNLKKPNGRPEPQYAFNRRPHFP